MSTRSNDDTSLYTQPNSHEFVDIVVDRFLNETQGVRPEGMLPKLCFFASTIEELTKELRPALEKTLTRLNMGTSGILVNVKEYAHQLAVASGMRYQLVTDKRIQQGDFGRLLDEDEESSYEIAPEIGKVVPFSILPRIKRQYWKNCLPLINDLKIAAGAWSEEQSTLIGNPGSVEDWIELPDGIRPEPGMFVACIQGHSMEPLVQNGDWCVFRAPGAGSRSGKRVLVWHSGLRDFETGSSYTFKEYHSEKVISEESFEHTKIVLKPLNKEYEPIVLKPEDEGTVRVIGEFVRTLIG